MYLHFWCVVLVIFVSFRHSATALIFECPSDGSTLRIQMLSSSVPVHVASDPLNCNVSIVGPLQVAGIIVDGVVNNVSVNIEIRDVTCGTNTLVCVHFTKDIAAFNSIHIQNVRHTDLNTTDSPGIDTIWFVQLIAFSGLVSTGRSLLIEDCVFKATLHTKNAHNQPLYFGILYFNSSISSISSGVTFRNSEFSSTIIDESNVGGDTRQLLGGVIFMGSISSANVNISGISHVLKNCVIRFEPASYSAILFAGAITSSGFLFSNSTVHNIGMLVASSYFTSNCVSIADGPFVIGLPYFIIEGINYYNQFHAGGQSETYFFSSPGGGFYFDFAWQAGILFRNIQAVIRNENSVSWSTNSFWWGRNQVLRLNFFVVDNVTWNSKVHSTGDIWNSELVFTNGLGAPVVNITNCNFFLDFKEKAGASRSTATKAHKFLSWQIDPGLILTANNKVQDLFFINNNVTFLFEGDQGYDISIDGRNLAASSNLGRIVFDKVNYVVLTDSREIDSSGDNDLTSVRMLGPYTQYGVVAATSIGEVTVRNIKWNVTTLISGLQTSHISLVDLTKLRLPLSAVESDRRPLEISNIDVTYQTASVARPWEYLASDINSDISDNPNSGKPVAYAFQSYSFYILACYNLMHRRYLTMNNISAEVAADASNESYASILQVNELGETAGLAEGIHLSNCHLRVANVKSVATTTMFGFLVHFHSPVNNVSRGPDQHALTVRGCSLVTKCYVRTEQIVVFVRALTNSVKHIDGILLENNLLHFSGAIDDEPLAAVAALQFRGDVADSTAATQFINVPRISLVNNTIEVGSGTFVNGAEIFIFAFAMQNLTAANSQPIRDLAFVDCHIRLIGEIDAGTSGAGYESSPVRAAIFDARGSLGGTATFPGATSIRADSCSVDLSSPLLDSFNADGVVTLKILSLASTADSSFIEVTNNTILIDGSKHRQWDDDNRQLETRVSVAEFFVLHALSNLDIDSAANITSNKIHIFGKADANIVDRYRIRPITTTSILILGNNATVPIASSDATTRILLEGNQLINEYEYACAVPVPNIETVAWSTCSLLHIERKAQFAGSVVFRRNTISSGNISIAASHRASVRNSSLAVSFITVSANTSGVFSTRPSLTPAVFDVREGNSITPTATSPIPVDQSQLFVRMVPVTRQSMPTPSAFYNSPTKESFLRNQFQVLLSKSFGSPDWRFCGNAWSNKDVIGSFLRAAFPAFNSTLNSLPPSTPIEAPEAIAQLPRHIRVCSVTKELSFSQSSKQTMTPILRYNKQSRTISGTVDHDNDDTPTTSTTESKSPVATATRIPSESPTTEPTPTGTILYPKPLRSASLISSNVALSALTLNAFAGPAYATVARKLLALAVVANCGRSAMIAEGVSATDSPDTAAAFLEEKLEPLGPDANPLGITIKSDLFASYRGAIVGNIVFVVAFGCGHFLLVLAYKCTHPASVSEAMEFFQFPGGTNVVLNVLFPAGAFAFAAMAALHKAALIVSPDVVDAASGDMVWIIVGGAVCFVAPCVIYTYWTYLIHSTQALEPRNKKQLNPLEKALGVTSAKERKKSALFRLYDFVFVNTREWHETPFMRKTGPAWDMFSVGAYLAVDWYVAVALSLGAGFSLDCETDSCCTAFGSLAVAVCGIQLVLMIWWRPLLVRFDIFALTIAAVSNAVASCLVLADFTTSPELDDVLAEATGIALLCGFYGGLVAAIVSVACVFLPLAYDKITTFVAVTSVKETEDESRGDKVPHRMSRARTTENKKAKYSISRNKHNHPLRDDIDDALVIEEMKSTGKFKFVDLMAIDDEREKREQQHHTFEHSDQHTNKNNNDDDDEVHKNNNNSLPLLRKRFLASDSVPLLTSDALAHQSRLAAATVSVAKTKHKQTSIGQPIAEPSTKNNNKKKMLRMLPDEHRQLGSTRFGDI